ncbi:MAG: acireductone synthase [Alphaproteobacteria bacterium]|nr:acireductone synthase [Alphaproteobacteria bacterium]
MNIRAIVTDIEGTTSSLSFVKDVLFPYARQHLAAFVRANANEQKMQAVLDEVSKLEGKKLDTEAAITMLLAWSDADKKITPLKSLQGMIWQKGYVDGAFTGHIYDDAVVGLKRWHEAGIKLYVYSSGSVPAQKLLFGHTPAGDLTPLFSGYFDTTIGGKLEAPSYRKIAEAINVASANILFLSDHAGELDAASEAGFSTMLLDREHNAPPTCHPRAVDFSTILLQEAA